MVHFHMFPPYAVSAVLSWHVCRLWVGQDSICPVLITQTGGLVGEGRWLPFFITAWTASALQTGLYQDHFLASFSLDQTLKIGVQTLIESQL